MNKKDIIFFMVISLILSFMCGVLLTLFLVNCKLQEVKKESFECGLRLYAVGL